MDAALGELIQVTGTLTLEVATLFRVTGDFAFVSSFGEVTLSDASLVEVDKITIGANNVPHSQV